MPNIRENYFVKWGTGLTASGAAYLGANMLDKTASVDANSVTGAVEWIAEAGGAVSATALLLGAAKLYAVRNRRKEIEKVRASLPEFDAIKPNATEWASIMVSNMDLSDRVKNRLSSVADAQRVAEMSSIGISPEERVKMVSDGMSADLALIRSQQPISSGELAHRWLDVADMGYVLDNVFPIRPDDSRTPETVTGERHWFDFAEQRSTLQTAQY